MQLDVPLARVASMLVRMNCVAMRYVSMVSGRLESAFARLLRRGTVVFSGLRMVFGRLLVVFLQFFHERSSVKY